MTEDCGICGLDLKEKYSHKLNCNHEYHYECLMKSFQNENKHKKEVNHCPYCRSKASYLPLVNSLKKVIPGVHCHSLGPTVKQNKELLKKDYNITCQHTLKRGKNKGDLCSKNSLLGYEHCKAHKKDNQI